MTFPVCRFIVVLRADRFSTRTSQEDEHVLLAVRDKLCNLGFACAMFAEDQFTEDVADDDYFNSCSLILSMARSNAALKTLSRFALRGVDVVNPPHGVARCSRKNVYNVLCSHYPELWPESGSSAYWVKGGTTEGMHAGHTTYCPTQEQAEKLKQSLLQQGYDDTILQPHIAGECVKFYGVGQGKFFKICFDKQEAWSVPMRSYNLLKQDVRRISQELSLSVYGGDAVITPDGGVVIVDFNDWPSFSPCRDEAVDAIIAHVLERQHALIP